MNMMDQLNNRKPLKISTWNVCLGLINKKDTVTETLNREGISICCLQETEIPMNFSEEILYCNNYNLELEMNNTKKRVGIYVAKSVNYIKRKDLERENLHIVIIDILGNRPTRIINVYRTFRPLDVTPGVFFNWSLHIANTIVKAKKALYALKLLKRFFNPSEMRTLLDTYFYSVLYYNSVVWLIPEIGPLMKQKLLSISACALRSCLSLNNCEISFERIHVLHKKCTPAKAPWSWG